jgi:serine/threonine-protein kinase
LECARDDRLGELQIGPARVLDVIHRGAVATTYRAVLPGYGRPMALRLLDARYGRSEELRTAYRRAVEPLLLFRHPNLAAVHDFIEHGDRCGVIADIAPGEPLSSPAGSVVLPGKTVDYCRQVVAGLLAAQRSGFVHHSLRPSRILATHAGRVLILGYGEPSWLSRLHRCELGNAANYYVAPEELAADRPVDARADLFAVGRIFLELALRRRVEPGDAIMLPSGYPRGFGSLLAQLTEIEPERRCQSASEVLEALDQLNPAGTAGESVLRRAA